MCICTRNRSSDLRRALIAAQHSTYPVHQLVVSDDSTDSITKEMVRSEFPSVTFVEGPRKGLSANRNNAIRAATGTHLLFIDDDAVLGESFFAKMAAHLQSLPGDRDRVIVTGTEFTHGEQVFAHRPTYLGHQAGQYLPGERVISTVINAAVFPRMLFKKIEFDENLIYGYEELDISMTAVLQEGYRIDSVNDAINNHYPSPINRDYYVPFTEASRLYVTFKHYWWLEKKRMKASIYLVVGMLHYMIHVLKNTHSISGFLKTARISLGYIRRHARVRADGSVF